MMRLSRTRLVALLAFLTLAVLLGSWFRTGWRSASSEAAAIREQPLLEARQELGDLALELASRLDGLRSKEDARPYYHYQNLFHDPRGLSEGKSVSPSPLVEETGDPLISVHFQIDLQGTLTIPPINEELEQFSQQEALVLNQDVLAELRAAKTQLIDEGVLLARLDSQEQELAAQQEAEALAQAEAERAARARRQRARRRAQREEAQRKEMQAQQAMPQGQMVAQAQQVTQQQFTQEQFQQNASPNTVFQELEQQQKKVTKKKPPKNTRAIGKAPGGAAPPEEAPAEEAVEVSIHSFTWKSATIGDTMELVAMRRIQTPEGDINQGFVVGSAELANWLESRGGEFPKVALVRALGDQDDTRSLAVPALTGWVLQVDTSEAEERAAAAAESLGSDFLWRFVPAAAVSLLLCVMMVLAVSRAEEIARERSQFAAAAAHELRTPLAGLQLYGDMLADGLGDQNAKEKYARHIADEAQRLGRVVSNVLGFSQMERKGVNLHLMEGNLADAVMSVVERMRPSLEENGMQIETDLPDELLAVFDEDALSRILQNLMDNAEKYSRDHEDRRLGIAVSEGEGKARVSISDGGPGVVTQKHQQIFKPFKRDTEEDGPAGLGLGLALARSLARQQGGDLRVQDSLFGGASFVLELPQKS